MSQSQRTEVRREEVSPTAAPSFPRSVPSERPSGHRVHDRRLRVLAFLVLCLLSAGMAGGYLLMAAQRTGTARSAGPLPDAAEDPSVLATISAQPHLLFLQSQGDAYRRVALVPLTALGGARHLTELQCQRVHFAAGQGLCLGQNPMGGAMTFGPDLQPRHTLAVSGIPSRVRVSPDGRYGAMTVFVTGHDYAQGAFSTQTTLVDMASGRILADLEQFVVYRDGVRLEAPDFNFWGVTFASDSNRFYATLGSGGSTYLIEGDVAARVARILWENVECPSLSPDNTRLVFKRRVSSGGAATAWRLYRLDLGTMMEQPLGEARGVDDQVEWLDDQQILYSLPDEGPPATIRPDVWALAVDGSSPPRLVQTAAFSPAIVR